MLLSRRNHALLQRPEGARPHLRRARTLGAALLLAGAGLTACDAPQDASGPAGGASDPAQLRRAIVTGAFDASAPAREIVFLPTTDSPWTGLVATALEEGGFDVFSVDGEPIASAGGPVLSGLAGASDFPLRGQTFPLLFGSDAEGALRGFAVIRQAGDVVELPLEGADAFTAAGVCAFSTGIGHVDLAVLSERAEAVIVRVRDTGGEGLSLSEQARIALPFPARACAAADGDLVIASALSGVARVGSNGETRAILSEAAPGDIAYSSLLGRPTIVFPVRDSSRIAVHDARDLSLIVEIAFEEGLNAPAFQAPVALAVTDASYGGMEYVSGLLGVYDRGDGRVKIVAREVLARAVVSPEG